MCVVTMLACVAVSFALDQVSKLLVMTHLSSGGSARLGSVILSPRLNRYATGAKCGGRRAWSIAWLVEATVLAWLLENSPWFVHEVAPIALGAALGGALGNLMDLWTRGGVLDFVDLGWWPTFNLADITIVAGAGAGLMCVWAAGRS